MVKQKNPSTVLEHLAGSLRGNIKLSDRELKEARKAFEKKWSRVSSNDKDLIMLQKEDEKNLKKVAKTVRSVRKKM